MTAIGTVFVFLLAVVATTRVAASHGRGLSVVSASPSTNLSDLLQKRNLHIIQFGGGEYRCSHEDWVALKQLSNKRVIFHLTNRSSCVESHRLCSHLPTVIEQVLCKYDTVPNCDNARCTCIILPELFGVNVRCTSSELPSSVPETTINLLMQGSQLKDFGDWLVYLNIPYVSKIDLRNNSLTMLPYIPPSSMKSLKILHLSKNLIQSLDLGTLEFYREYFDLKLSIDGNPLICDCGMAGITNYLMESDPEILDEQLIFCQYMNRTTRPWLVDFSKCFKEDYSNLMMDCGIGILLVITGLAFYIAWDTEKAYREAHIGKQSARVPRLSRLITRISDFWKDVKCRCCRKKTPSTTTKKVRKESVLEMLLNSNLEEPDEYRERKRRSEPAIRTQY